MPDCCAHLTVLLTLSAAVSESIEASDCDSSECSRLVKQGLIISVLFQRHYPLLVSSSRTAADD